MTVNDVRDRIGLKMILDKIIESRTGDQCLNPPDTAEKLVLTAAVQFRKNIIKKKDRRIPGRFPDHADLRQF